MKIESIIRVLKRELVRMRQQPVYLLGSVGVMAFSCLFYLTMFNSGMPSELPIGVVDKDNSSNSRSFCMQLDATQLGKVIKYDDFESARKDMQTGKITSLVVIPAGFNDDVQANRKPVFTYYVNSLYLIGGALGYKEVLTMVTMAGGAVQRELLRAEGMGEDALMGQIQSILIDEHKIGNGVMDYGSYLNNTLLPGILELSIVFVIIYAIGSELRYGTTKELLKTADGSMTAAMIGKLLPYTVIYLIIGIALDFLMFKVCHYPLNGSIWNMMLGMVVFVFSCEAVGITLIGLFPTIRYALSLGALFSILAFSFSGFTFPVEAMPGIVKGISVLFPLRFYYLFYVQEALFGAGFAAWWPFIVYMLLFLVGPILVTNRLWRAYEIQNYPV